MIAALAGALALLALAAGPAAAAECANEGVRSQQHSTFLAQCRAYELVTPPKAIPALGLGNKHTRGARASAATVGEYAGAIAWYSRYPYPSAGNYGRFLLSRRQSGQWVTAHTTPDQGSGDAELTDCEPYPFYAPTLEAGVMSANFNTDATQRGEEEYCPAIEPAPFLGNESEGVQNLFVKHPGAAYGVSTSYSLVDPASSEGQPAGATLQDAVPDLGAILFSESSRLTPEAPEGEDLYEASAGAVRLVTFAPDGVPMVGIVANATKPGHERGASTSGLNFGASAGAAPFTHAMSLDGTRVVFETATETSRKLYLRVNATQPQSTINSAHETAANGEQCAEASMACTIQLDASEAGGSGGGAVFLWANQADTKIFFMDQAAAKLTADTKANSGDNLYEYTLPIGASVGKLTDLTPEQEHAEVQGISGLGESGATTFAYFVADGALSGANAEGKSPVEGAPNVYVLREGTAPVFIATLAAGAANAKDWTNTTEYAQLTASVAPNGRYLAFEASSQPTGYDNTDINTGRNDAQIYVYDNATHQLRCASCGPAEQRPVGPSLLQAVEPATNSSAPAYLKRVVLDNGEVFFNTPNPLIPSEDTNGQEDVYEYHNGELSLISSGSATNGAYFYEATPSGSDVFFVTAKSLLGADTDAGRSLYDAREYGGVLEAGSESGACGSTQECQGAGSPPPVLASPPSVSFAGLGNLKPRPAKSKTTQGKKGKAKKSGKARAKRRRRKLRHALKRCARLHRHNRDKRRACKRRARKQYGAKAKGAARRRHRRHKRHAGRAPHHSGRTR